MIFNQRQNNDETVTLKIVEQWINNTQIKVHDVCMIFNLRQGHNEIVTLKIVERLINTHRKVCGTGLKEHQTQLHESVFYIKRKKISDVMFSIQFNV